VSRTREETIVAYSYDASSQRGPAPPSQDDQSSDASTDSPASTPPAPRDHPELADALGRAGYHATRDQVAELASSGTTPGFVQTLAASGIRLPDIHSLAGACDRGVDRAFLQAVVRNFGTGIAFADAMALRDDDIGAAYLDALAGLGYDHLSVRDVTALAENGISTSYIRELAAAGYTNLTPHQLIEWHSEGIDGDFLHTLADHGYQTPADVVRMHDRGVGS
jgi:hypothetical protein